MTHSPSTGFSAFALRPSRRTFCRGAAGLLLQAPALLRGVTALGQTVASTRPDVAAIDHDRILAAAARCLTMAPMPLTSLPCPRSPGAPHDFYSEVVPDADAGSDASSTPPLPPFTGHRDALFELGLAVPALAAAYLLTADPRYAEHALLHLRAWFIDPASKMTPALNFAQVTPAPAATHPSLSGVSTQPVASGRFEGIIESLPLAEVAQAIPFLAVSPACSDSALAALRGWFAAYLDWLTAPEDSGPRLPALARDSKDHHGTSWLLQVAAYATFAPPDGTGPRAESHVLTGLRHQFKTSTLRAQIAANGSFPHELGSSAPYRNSLFNLDMLAAICHLLSTRFESIWDYELQDGPGMRGAIAYHVPYIADRSVWPYRADAQHFDELPSRRVSLLLCARAYQRPEYADLWKKLQPDRPSASTLRTLPVHQPLLWVRQPPLRT